MKEVRAVLKHLDIGYKDISIVTVRPNDTHYRDALHGKKMEKQFLTNSAKPESTYIVSSRGRIWVIHKKTTIDPSWTASPNAQNSRRRLESITEILS